MSERRLKIVGSGPSNEVLAEAYREMEVSIRGIRILSDLAFMAVRGNNRDALEFCVCEAADRINKLEETYRAPWAD